MSEHSDAIKRLERGRDVLQAQLTVQRTSLQKGAQALSVAKNEVSKVRSQFNKLHAQLQSHPKVVHPLTTEALLAALGRTRGALKTHTAEVAVHERTVAALSQRYRRTELKVDSLHKQAKRLEEAQQTRSEEQLIEDRLPSIATPDTTVNDNPPASTPFSSSSGNYPTFHDTDRQNNSGTANDTPAYQSSYGRTSDTSFKLSAATPEGSAVTDMSTWSGLGGQGVSLSFKARTGRVVDIRLIATAEHAVRVELVARNEGDRRVLWREKQEISEELARNGVTVRDFVITTTQRKKMESTHGAS